MCLQGEREGLEKPSRERSHHVTSLTVLDLLTGESAQVSVSGIVKTTLCREKAGPNQGPPLHFLQGGALSSSRHFPLAHSNVSGLPTPESPGISRAEGCCCRCEITCFGVAQLAGLLELVGGSQRVLDEQGGVGH